MPTDVPDPTGPGRTRPGTDPLGVFSAPTRAWFTATFAEPTPAQSGAWPAIASGEHTLVLAPTGSGKTLAAFLWALDRLATRRPPTDPAARTRVVYVSPLRALAVDVEKNLRAPLSGIAATAEALGVELHRPTVGVRTGDTGADERRRLVRHPPDILITTPESLYLMVTSRARGTLTGIEAVIVDEIHALAPTKRGAHLQLTLERLVELTGRSPQRIALSATQRPLDEMALFLGGAEPGPAGRPEPRPVTVVDAGISRGLDVEVVVPVEDPGTPGEVTGGAVEGAAAAGPRRRSIWPAVHQRLLELVESHRSTLVFTNTRRLAERLAARLNQLATGTGPDTAGGPPEGAELVKAHHGSLSRQHRLLAEDELKRGELRGLVATSSLELGIDMGAVDLVVQVASPGSVAAALQRIGRAGHRVGEPARGRIFPRHRGELLEAAVLVDRMRQGLVEEIRFPRNPLDVLAQHVVAMCALDDWHVDDLAAVVRRAAPFTGLSDRLLYGVLDLLSGVYPAEEFAGLRPRIVWDRTSGMLRARQGAQRLAVTNAGTIADRGLYGVFLPDGTRVGELDEEMVHESRVGEVFLLGASTWRIDEITPERVVVTPAPGRTGRMPFWHGDGPGRPAELGRAIGTFVRELRSDPDPVARLRERHACDERAAVELLAFLDEQVAVTGAVPDDRTIVVERFPDEIGDWRVCILTTLGARVTAPWAMAIRARLAERWGEIVGDPGPDVMWSDDGIVVRLPEALERVPVDAFVFEPDEIADLVVAHLPGTALFAARFRECAARALLLPRRRPDRRTPLWQQRRRAADLLGVAARHPGFPLLLETTRECLEEVFDLAALKGLMADIGSRRVRLVPVDTTAASPFARSLLSSWVAAHMYEGDAPLAERRATALALDRDLLGDLLGDEELGELLDPGVVADLELELQCLADRHRVIGPDGVHDLLRRLGPLSRAEVAARAGDPDRADAWLDDLVGRRRAFPARVAGVERLAAAEDAARVRDALGVALPPDLPAAFTEPLPDPLGDLCVRHALTHGPFGAGELAGRLGLPVVRVRERLDRLVADGRLLSGGFRSGGFRSGGSGHEYCAPEVLTRLRRRSLAALRREIEPVDPVVLARFLPAWQQVGPGRRDPDALVDVIAQLQGVAVPASVLDRDVLAVRLADHRPADLDALVAAGEVVWVGAGSLGARDGRVRLVFRDNAAALLTDLPGHGAALDGSDGVSGRSDGVSGRSDGAAPDGPVHEALRRCLGERGASFWTDLVAAVAAAGAPHDEATVLAAVWDLVWAGEVTADSLAPLRALLAAGGGSAGAGAGARRGRPRPGRLRRSGPPAGAGRWSCTADLVRTRLSPTVSPTERALERSRQLLERHGVLTREAVLAEGVKGGFAAVYPVLRRLEDRGDVRRGYFVAGLGGAQFALPGAVDRLRGAREADATASPLVLAATDPAQPYGAALRWPPSAGRPARRAGAQVVLDAGCPLVLVEPGGRSLVTFEGADDVDRWLPALDAALAAGRLPRLEIARVDGKPVRDTPWAHRLAAAGFRLGYRGLTRHPSRLDP